MKSLFVLSLWLGVSAVLCLAQEQPTCKVEIRLGSVSCPSANDDPDESVPPRGEYYIHLDNNAEVGPFELKAGENSGFSPGLLLKAIDTGIVKPEGHETVISISFVIYVREDDSTPPGEDDTDDVSVPIKIRERVVCPGTTTLARTIVIPPNPDFDEKERPDQVALNLTITAR